MSKLRRCSDGLLAFWCPGCQCAHGVFVGGAGRPVWGWNGSMDAPTFTPSIRVQGSEMTEAGRRDFEAWRASGSPRRGRDFEVRAKICHSFVRDGRIQFLADSSHALAAQTVEIPEWDDV